VLVTEIVEHALETVELTKSFGRFLAVDRVSFTVERGEIFGFLGPNGAGKTTTMRMLLSLLAPTSGSARVLGHDVVRDVARIRRHTGYMSQRFSLYNDLTVGQNLTFFGGTYGLRGRRLQERLTYALEMAGLAGREREMVRTLAGGWRQRLALGCAILHEPEMLFLDEPTAGVDPISRRGFWELLYALSAGGQTILVTTHYMDEAERCHRLAFIQTGRIVALGTPEEIKRTQMPGEVLELDCDQPGKALAALRADPDLASATLYGAQIHLVARDAVRTAAHVRFVLSGQGLAVRSLQVIAPSLEDAFIASVEQHSEHMEEG
jgi:ABC-2 type transport system ATP-binding protein